MNLAEIIAVALLGAEAPVLAALIVRWVRRRRATPPPARPDVGLRRLQEDVRRMSAELHGLAQDIDRRLEDRLAQLNDAIASCEERISQLRALGMPPAPEPAAAEIDQGEPAAAAEESDEQLDEGEVRSQYVGDGEIARLADEGLPAFEIARRLDRQVGEVELAMRLRKAGRGQTQSPSPKS